MIHGSSQPRTARKAIGHESAAGGGDHGPIFFPLPRRSRLLAGGGVCWYRRWRGACWSGHRLHVSGMIPAKAEGTTDELPVSPNGASAADLIVRPPQGVFDLLVAL